MLRVRRTFNGLFKEFLMFVAAALASLAAATAPTAQVVPTQTPTVQPATPVKEKKVCTSETVSGSIMPKRVCRTQAEAQAEAKEVARRSIELPSRQGSRN
jgi:hypothetical protein